MAEAPPPSDEKPVDSGDQPDEGGGVVTAAEIIARGDTLDIPYESPDPSTGPIQYGGDAPANPVDDPKGQEYRLAWANNFIFGTPAPPEPEEEGDGKVEGSVHPVPKAPDAQAPSGGPRVPPGGKPDGGGGPAAPPRQPGQ